MTTSTPSVSNKKSVNKQKDKIGTISVASYKPKITHACQSCNALPVGSIDLTALMLVLVFSLTAVLLTSVYALNLERAKVSALKEGVSLSVSE